LYGEDDDFGEAGILCHIMNTSEIAAAMVELARNPELRERYAEAGYARLMRKYKLSDMRETYKEIYHQFSDEMGLEWVEDEEADEGSE
jgi:glycosyltransferase involved in cell wall biosynthesis